MLQETTGHFRVYLYSGCTRLNLERRAGHRGLVLLIGRSLQVQADVVPK